MEDLVVTCSGIMVELWILNSGYWQQNGGNFSELWGICDKTAKKMHTDHSWSCFFHKWCGKDLIGLLYTTEQDKWHQIAKGAKDVEMGTRNGAISETNFGFVIWSDPKLEKIGSDWLYKNMSLYHKWGLIMVKLQRTWGLFRVEKT